MSILQRQRIVQSNLASLDIQNVITLQQLVSIYDGTGLRILTVVRVILRLIKAALLHVRVVDSK